MITHVSICGSIICAISGISGANFTMTLTQPQVLQILPKFESRVIMEVDSKCAIRFHACIIL